MPRIRFPSAAVRTARIPRNFRSLPCRLSALSLAALCLAALCLILGSAPAAASDDLDAWTLVDLPLVGWQFDLATTPDGTVLALSSNGLVSRLEASSWRTLPIPSGRRDRLALAVPPGRSDTVFRLAGSLLRSDDGGESWFDAGPWAVPILRIAFDPVEPDRWIVIDSARRLARTADDGATWTEIDGPQLTGDVIVGDLLVTRGGTLHLLLQDLGCPILCVRQRGLYSSTDDGATWTLRADVTGSLLVEPAGGGLLAQLDGGVGLSRSLDDGATWQPVGVAGAVVDVVERGGTLYAATTDGALYRSTDVGASWTLVVDELFGAGGILSGLTIDPSTADGLDDRLVVAGRLDFIELDAEDRVLESTDGGETWTRLDSGLDTVRVDAVALSPVAGHVLAAHRDRLLSTSDGGATWSIGSEGLQERVDDLEIWPLDDRFAYAAGRASEDGSSLLVSVDGGASWQPLDPPRRELAGVAVSPLDRDVVLVSSAIDHGVDPPGGGGVDGPGVYRSTDGGTTWTEVLGGSAGPLEFDPSSPNVVYATAGSTLWRSADSGATWRAVGPGPSQLAVGPDALYGLFLSPLVAGIHRSTDGGKTWTLLPAPIVNPAGVTTIAVGAEPGRVLFGTRGEGAYQSFDGGRSWNRLAGDPGLPILDLDADADFEAWAGTDGGGLLRGRFQRTPLVLRNGRFSVEVEWRDFDGGTGRGFARSQTSDTGTLWFFGRDNLELMVKVLDGRAVNGSWWVYYGALSNVELTVTVTDRWNGRRQIYTNPLGNFASLGDVDAFDANRLLEPAPAGATPPPTSETPELRLGDRFVATVAWRDFEGVEGEGTAVQLTSTFDGGPGDTGAFWFFGERNLELMVKVLDGRAVNGRWWVFFGSLSNVEFTLRIEDTVTGAVREYENPLGAFASRGDVEAF